jgi:hypothetical protein
MFLALLTGIKKVMENTKKQQHPMCSLDYFYVHAANGALPGALPPPGVLKVVGIAERFALQLLRAPKGGNGGAELDIELIRKSLRHAVYHAADGVLFYANHARLSLVHVSHALATTDQGRFLSSSLRFGPVVNKIEDKLEAIAERTQRALVRAQVGGVLDQAVGCDSDRFFAGRPMVQRTASVPALPAGLLPGTSIAVAPAGASEGISAVRGGSAAFAANFNSLGAYIQQQQQQQYSNTSATPSSASDSVLDGVLSRYHNLSAGLIGPFSQQVVLGQLPQEGGGGGRKQKSKRKRSVSKRKKDAEGDEKFAAHQAEENRRARKKGGGKRRDRDIADSTGPGQVASSKSDHAQTEAKISPVISGSPGQQRRRRPPPKPVVTIDDAKPNRVTNPLLSLPFYPRGITGPNATNGSTTTDKNAAILHSDVLLGDGGGFRGGEEGGTVGGVGLTNRLDLIPAAGEVWFLMEIYYPDVLDTYPISYLARLLGFDIPHSLQAADIAETAAGIVTSESDSAGGRNDGAKVANGFSPSDSKNKREKFDPATAQFIKPDDDIWMSVPDLGDLTAIVRKNKGRKRKSGFVEGDNYIDLDEFDPMWMAILCDPRLLQGAARDVKTKAGASSSLDTSASDHSALSSPEAAVSPMICRESYQSDYSLPLTFGTGPSVKLASGNQYPRIISKDCLDCAKKLITGNNPGNRSSLQDSHEKESIEFLLRHDRIIFRFAEVGDAEILQKINRVSA